ncbi:MAG: DUF1622 domain-containing protein [Cellvibrionaceae bacterium]
MSDLVTPVAEWSAAIIELLGVLIIAGFTVYTVAFAATHFARQTEPEVIYQDIRQRLGRGILLGLEFLVAADIIYTVAVELTFQSVGVLASILVIRTFLSFTLELELTGSWPWQRSA